MNEELGKIRFFTDLDAWKEGHRLVLMIYKLTKEFPRDELFGLVSQMRRCAVSVTSNIAEGYSRQSYREKVQFYSMAQGSVTELQNQLIISKDVKIIAEAVYEDVFLQSTKVHKILSGLIKKTKSFYS